MDVVLVGLPGSGKSVVGRRLASRHGASFIDLDERIESAAGRTIPEIFEEDGEPAFRALERAAIADLGPADPAPEVRRVIATGGGAVVDPRNRWALYPRPDQRLARRPARGPRPAAAPLAARPAARQRPRPDRRDPRPRVATRAVLRGGDDPPGRRRPRSTASSTRSTSALGARWRPRPIAARPCSGRPRRSAGSCSATGSPPRRVAAELDALRARRAILVSEPGAWAAVGERLAAGLAATRPRRRPRSCCPQGEAAKRLSVVETAARELAAMRVERSRAARGGRRRRARRHGRVPRRDLPPRRPLHPGPDDARRPDRFGDRRQDRGRPAGGQEPRRGVPPAGGRSSSTSTALRTLPERQLRAALGEAVKMAALGDERLFELLEADGPAIAARRPGGLRVGRRSPSSSSGPPGRRWRWSSADERERGAAGGRITLNLGHSLGHAVEAAAGYGELLHGEAVAYGLRAATRIGVEVGVTPPERAARIDAAARRARPRPPSRSPTRSRRCWSISRPTRSTPAGRLRWVLPTADGRGRPRRRRPGHASSAAAAAMLAAPSGESRDDRASSSSRDRTSTCVGTREPEIYGHEIARGDPRRDRDAGRRARARGRLLPVQPRGRAHRPAPPARLRRGDRQCRRADPHERRAARRAARRRSGRSSRSTCRTRPRASPSGRSTSCTTSRSNRSSGRVRAATTWRSSRSPGSPAADGG